ncbi:energy-coupling factor transporter transmembrane protein EcfT [Clostridium cadaveris]|nr:energy-coupling factor transporter transmembrane protein EcfT [Clostridium cadaveris]NWK10201.1 energy-coupling factor transporter transmembrane protein EcfT [Clostridium cadaveris]UFH66648.1 energy-coupling factor transporter transmembrane protein EcfT [Clostridium cadaveris]
MAIWRQRLDFRTKLFMTIVISYTLLLGNLQQKYLAVAVAASLLPYVLLISERRYKEALKGGIFIIVASIIQKYFLYNATGILTSLFLFISMLFLRMLPGLMMGKYTLVSTDMSELVCSLKKMKIPDQIVIPITVMARFFYTFREDYSQIKDAMYLHGLTTKRLILNPLKLFEYRTVPLLMCLTRTADEVAISALTRGMEIGVKRSSISTSKIKEIDYIFFLIMFLLIGFYIRGKYA